MKDFKLKEAIATSIVRRDSGEEAKSFAFYAPELKEFQVETAYIEDGTMQIVIKKAK